ncbi:MAG TPA: TolC family protein [Waterburya sp.]|jgi:outer membrane protein TolC
MRKSPDIKCPNQRDYLSFPSISLFISTVIGILIALFGTAWTFTLAFKPQQTPKPVTSYKTTLKLPKIQPNYSQSLTKIFSQGNQPLKIAGCKDTEIRKRREFSSPIHGNISLLKELPSNTEFNLNWISVELPTFSKPSLPSTLTSMPNQTQEKQLISPLSQQIYQSPSGSVSLLAPNQTQPTVSQGREVRLTLSDIVILALENNRPLKNAYLERIAQRQELAVAENKFIPNFTPTISISLAQFGSNRTRNTDGDVGIGATVSVKIPTGGQLSFGWSTNGQAFFPNGLNLLNSYDDPWGQNLQLSFNQPLLRGAGVNINRASMDIARLTEQINILDLKSTLINTITEAVIAYRELIRSQERLKIAQFSLKSAQESLTNNRILIEAGRLAPVDIVQSETEVARRQVSVVEAENNLEAARLALLNIIDIDKNAVIVATDPPAAVPVSLNPDKLRQLVFKNQPDYLKARLDLERTKLALLEAENNRLWDLNVNTSYSYDLNNDRDLRIGLALSHKFDDLTVERDFKRSAINKLKAENTLKEQSESLEIKLKDRIRDVSLTFSQVELAKKLTESSEKQLNIAREKQKLGRDITIFELVRLHDDLVQARNVELNAIINYLNALTRLDQILGTTLDTWQITVERK